MRAGWRSLGGEVQRGQRSHVAAYPCMRTSITYACAYPVGADFSCTPDLASLLGLNRNSAEWS